MPTRHSSFCGFDRPGLFSDPPGKCCVCVCGRTSMSISTCARMHRYGMVPYQHTLVVNASEEINDRLMFDNHEYIGPHN